MLVLAYRTESDTTAIQLTEHINKTAVGDVVVVVVVTANPTAPSPKTATVEPGSTAATFQVAPTPAHAYGCRCSTASSAG